MDFALPVHNLLWLADSRTLLFSETGGSSTIQSVRLVRPFPSLQHHHDRGEDVPEKTFEISAETIRYDLQIFSLVNDEHTYNLTFKMRWCYRSDGTLSQWNAPRCLI
jgi:hypothetical protein